MRALQIAYVINSVEGGGAAMPVPAIARALRAAGIDLQIFALTGRDRRALPAMLDAGLNVTVRPDGEHDHATAFRWLDEMIAAMSPDVIWTSLTRATLLGQLVGLRRRIPVVSWQHAAFLRPSNRRLLRFTEGRSAFWIADSLAVNTFTQRALGVSSEKILTWPLFAADSHAPQATAWAPGQTLRLGSLGRLHPVKGYDVLIRALASIRAAGPLRPRVEVIIAGEGGERSHLIALADDLGVTNIAFNGFCADPREFLSGLHLYVQPSKSEGFCVAAHEAMQAGLPIIASKVGELAYSVESGATGYLVAPNAPDELAEAIQMCLWDPSKLKAMGDAGRARLLSRFSDAEFERGARGIAGRLEQLCRAG